jgi:hypothetical protein
MKRFGMTVVVFGAFLLAMTACFPVQPAPAASNTQAANQQTGTSASGLTAGGGVELRLRVTGEGWVNITPPGSNCGPDVVCTYQFARGTELTIYTDAPAIPGSNHSFKQWGGDCRSLGRNPYPNLTINSSMDCLAEFTPEGR